MVPEKGEEEQLGKKEDTLEESAVFIGREFALSFYRVQDTMQWEAKQASQNILDHSIGCGVLVRPRCCRRWY